MSPAAWLRVAGRGGLRGSGAQGGPQPPPLLRATVPRARLGAVDPGLRAAPRPRREGLHAEEWMEGLREALPLSSPSYPAIVTNFDTNL